MPPKRPKRTRGRTLPQNARNAFIEEQFPDEARRRNLDPQVIWSKRKKDSRRERIVKSCSARFPFLNAQGKRWYQYQVEKKWPFWFERPNGEVETRHLDPGPERTVEFELGHFSRKKKGDPRRDQWLEKQRPDPTNMTEEQKASQNELRDIILRARAKLQPFAPAAPPVPSNETLEKPLPGEEEQGEDGALLFGGSWACHKVLYLVPNTTVLLYREQDENNNTTDTMVIKKERRSYNYVWFPGLHALNAEEGSVHALVHQQCRKRTLEYRHDKFSQDDSNGDLIKIIATEWVPHGTLGDLVDYYRRKKHLIPEPFVWYCFRAVTENVLVCWNGHVGKGADPWWEHVVNCDIKPDNVFLGAPDPREPMVWARRYPQPKVGDFGLAFTTHSGLDDTNHPTKYRRRVNPPDFRGFGTRGSIPPENLPRTESGLRHMDFILQRIPAIQNRLATLGGGEESGAHSWTMVWQIGMLIWCMMTNSPYGSLDMAGRQFVTDFSDPAGSCDFPLKATPSGVPMRPGYSGRLVELVYQCLAFRPLERIGLEDLWDEVVEGCNDVAAAFDGHQDDPPPDGPNYVSVVPDKYPVGQNVLNDTG